MREYLDYKFGFMKRKETDYNNMQVLLHSEAGKIAQAVWGSKDYKKPFKKVEWTDNILMEEDSVRINRKQNDTLKRIESQYGIKLTKEE